MTRILMIIGSVRPGRIGLPIAQWAREQVEQAGHEVDLVDLVELGLPFMDEPVNPSKRQYAHRHTLDWSARVEAAEAVVLVSPEYNHSYSPALKNAIDFLYHEWNAKPVGIVSYGGVSGGLRAAVALEPVLTAVGLVRVPADVVITAAGTLVADGVFAATERHEAGIAAMAQKLEEYGQALRPLH